MYYYIFICICSVCLYTVYPNINSGYLYLCDKYEQTKKAKEIFAKDKSYVYLFTMLFSTLFTVFYMMFTSYIQKFIHSFCIKEVSKNTFEVQLFIRNRLLKFRVHIKKGPNDVLQILDKDTNDITKELEPYFNARFVDVTLKDVGYEELDLCMSDGNVRTLTSEDVLKL